MIARPLAALAATVLAAALSVRAAAPAPAPAGISRFTRHARFVEAAISPKGTYLAAISEESGNRTLVFIDLKKRKIVSQLAPDFENMPGDFWWVNDGRVVIELIGHESGLAGPVYRGELYAVDATGKNGLLVFGFRAGADQTALGSHLRHAERERGWAQVLDPNHGDGRKILISSTSFDDTFMNDVRVYKLDVYTGVKTEVTRAPIANAWFATDEDGEVRIAAGYDDKLKPRYFVRDPGGFWQDLPPLSSLRPDAEPVGYVAREGTLYAVEPDGKGFAVVAVTIDTGGRKVLSRQDMATPSCLVWDRATRKIVAVEWEPDVPVTEVIDPGHAVGRVLRALEATYPDERVRIVSRTDDQTKMVVYVDSDRDPGRFLLVDSAKMTAEPLLENRPWIAPAEMAETSAFHVAASDGLRIHGYVTLPRGERNGPLPMVVLPHGGPHGVRDHWAFDSQAQLLASEGFAVLRVNYRGSGGYGLPYQEAGYGHWGDRVVQDVVDATRWAVKKGFADPARICAVGGSFGAYASMQAAILAPDLFRCAVGISGVYDLTRMSRTGDTAQVRPGRVYLRNVLGTDDAALRAASPVFEADRLRARVMLVHGGEDRRAPIAHAEQMRDALVRAGRPPEWLVEPREGHGFYDEGARERMWTRVVAFLKESTAATGSPSAASPAAPAGSTVPAKAPAGAPAVP